MCKLLLSLFGKIFEKPENTASNCYILMTLLFSHFSTSFWEVMLMPAIYIPTTRNIGLLTPLREHVLDYHSTTNLAGYSRLLHLYSFISIKHKMLVTSYVPYCLPYGLKTLFFVLNNRFLLLTSIPKLIALPIELPPQIRVGGFQLRCKKILGRRMGFEPTLS